MRRLGWQERCVWKIMMGLWERSKPTYDNVQLGCADGAARTIQLAQCEDRRAVRSAGAVVAVARRVHQRRSRVPPLANA